MSAGPRLLNRNRLIGLVVLIIVLVAMILNTKFLTAEELAAAGPKKFDPQQTATDLFAKAQSELPGKAADLGEVLPALQSDLKGAAEKYQAIKPNESTYIFPVKATGTVTDASAASLRITVDGVDDTPIIVPLTTAINGTVLRDAMGFKFADAPGQTDFQFVGDELKKLMQDQVSSGLSDPASMSGKKVDVVGVVSVSSATGAPPSKAKPVNIQPISIKEGA